MSNVERERNIAKELAYLRAYLASDLAASTCDKDKREENQYAEELICTVHDVATAVSVSAMQPFF